MIKLMCSFLSEHVHEFPDDWEFGGANETDPRADLRWKSTTYTYFDARLNIVHYTQVPLCDNEAINYFHQIASWGPKINPVWVSATRPDGTVETLKVNYHKTDGLIESTA